MPQKRKRVSRTSKSKTHARQHPKHFLKVYWPYIPLIILVVVGMVFGVFRQDINRSRPATLAYATEMSISALLSNTNSQRASNGLPPLTLNSKLNSSAQSKANDMVARNYWSHNTPDGNEPWIFFDAAGYPYQKAGENLAYGFSTSGETVVGWMNSPSHRANILDSSFTEVGFGFTNGDNFNGAGQETVVVAHYALPVASAPSPVAQQPAAPSQPQTLPATEEVSAPNPQQQPAPAPAEAVEEPAPVETNDEITVEEKKEDIPEAPVTSESPVPTDLDSKNITRLQSWTGGRAAWSAVAVSSIAIVIVGVWLIKHILLVKKFVRRGEDFVAHHPVFDLIVVAVVAFAVYLSQTSGVIL